MTDEDNEVWNEGEEPAVVVENRQLREQLRGWETVASAIIQVIPLLKEEMSAVIHMTEGAVMDLAAHLRVLASRWRGEDDRAATLSHIVTALQFQDITRQRLERVGRLLEEVGSHLKKLLEMGARSSAVPSLEEEKERHVVALMARWGETTAARGWDRRSVAGMPSDGEEEAGSVTLF
jgi:chemotaxis regulatin CheY-phosphate phosphatase CheZ